MKRIIITPESVNEHYWKDVWSFRSLFYILAWRDVAVRYKQTVIGILWAVLRPALTIAVFWLVGWVFSLPSYGVPRIILVTAATLPWQLVSSAFSDAANSLINNSGLISKVYFPIIILPVSSVIVCIIDFLGNQKKQVVKKLGWCKKIKRPLPRLCIKWPELTLVYNLM